MAVRLTRIYTRGGDTGQTSRADGARVAKHDPLVSAVGAVDEANAALGVAATLADNDTPEKSAGCRIHFLILARIFLCLPETVTVTETATVTAAVAVVETVTMAAAKKEKVCGFFPSRSPRLKRR